jgi:hypothetical protein
MRTLVNCARSETFSAIESRTVAASKRRKVVMLVRKIAMALALGVAGIGAMTVTQPASAGVVVGVGIGLPTYGPPAPIVERVGVRPGYFWTPGYWHWDGYRYGWRGGYWGAMRVGYRYAPGYWGGCGGRWCYHGGRWVR